MVFWSVQPLVVLTPGLFGGGEALETCAKPTEQNPRVFNHLDLWAPVWFILRIYE